MLQDIKTGMITKVIVYKLDRISRSILDFANIIQTFKKNDVEFHSSTKNRVLLLYGYLTALTGNLG